MAKKKDPVSHFKTSTWYHGTTLDGWRNICKRGIICDHNKGHELDFGYGFYLTPNREQAEKFIQILIKRNRSNLNVLSQGVFSEFIIDDTPSRLDIGVVIEFEFNPMDWLASKRFKSKLYGHFDDEFAEFVLFNRTENAEGQNQHNYDFIMGRMSDSRPIDDISEFRQGLIDKQTVLDRFKQGNSSKQLSIHNQALCDTIKPSRAYIIETGEELKVSDYNTNKSKKRIPDEPAS